MKSADPEKRDRVFVIHGDVGSILDALSGSLDPGGRPNTGAGLIWGLILSFSLLLLFLGAALLYFFP